MHILNHLYLFLAVAGGCPPPPPPCPPPCMPPPPDMSGDADDRSALFAQINQGQDITKSIFPNIFI